MRAKKLIMWPKLIVGFVSLLFFSLDKLPAAVNTWTSIGPDGANVLCVAVASSDASIVYVGTLSGIFKSTDGGESFSRLTNVNNIPYLGQLCVHGIAIDPGNPQKVYMSTNESFWRSSDGGGHWERTSTTLPQSYTIAIDPTDTSVIYLGSYGGPAGIYKSTDGGSSFTQLGGGVENAAVLSIAINPANSQIVYLASFNYGSGTEGVFKEHRRRLDLGGLSTTDLLGAARSAWPSNPHAPDTLYAGDRGAGIYKTTDGGANWSFFDRSANRHTLRSAL